MDRLTKALVRWFAQARRSTRACRLELGHTAPDWAPQPPAQPQAAAEQTHLPGTEAVHFTRQTEFRCEGYEGYEGRGCGRVFATAAARDAHFETCEGMGGGEEEAGDGQLPCPEGCGRRFATEGKPPHNDGS